MRSDAGTKIGCLLMTVVVDDGTAGLEELVFVVKKHAFIPRLLRPCDLTLEHAM
jgi:hypothetical protein